MLKHLEETRWNAFMRQYLKLPAKYFALALLILISTASVSIARISDYIGWFPLRGATVDLPSPGSECLLHTSDGANDFVKQYGSGLTYTVPTTGSYFLSMCYDGPLYHNFYGEIIGFSYDANCQYNYQGFLYSGFPAILIRPYPDELYPYLLSSYWYFGVPSIYNKLYNKIDTITTSCFSTSWLGPYSTDIATITVTLAIYYRAPDNCDESNDCGNTCNNTDTGSSANLRNGNLSQSRNIIITPKSLSFALNYNSVDSTISQFGRGWTHTYDLRITANSYGLLYRGNDGNTIQFRSADTITYIPDTQSGDISIIVMNSDSTYTRTLKEDIIQTFNAAGKLTSIKDRNGNTTTLSYSSNDRSGILTGISDSTGRALNFTNSDGKITTIIDPAGQIYGFTYNGDILTAVSDPVGNAWAYTYDTNNRMQTKTDPMGFQTMYSFDAYGALVNATDPYGQVKSISYDSINGKARYIEKDGGIWLQTYDPQLNQPTAKTDPQGNVTRYSYDSKGNLLTKTEPDGSISTYTYDANNNMTSLTDALGNTSTYTYNTFGQVVTRADPQGNMATYTYDDKGNLLSITDPIGAITNYQYDSKGNVTSTTNAMGLSTTFAYDQYNNVILITDPMGASTRITYDINGNMNSQSDASGNTATFVYNNLNQLVQSIDPNNNSSTFAYDPDGNLTLWTDANGNTTFYEYNYKGQIRQKQDTLNNVTSYAYGATGCPSCSGGTDKLTSVTDAAGNATAYQYDKLGRLISETDPLGNMLSYTYDVIRNLLSRTDANGHAITYSYDADGRLRSKYYPDGTMESFTYDASGNIITAANQNISYNFTYDADRRVTNVTDSNNRTVGYQYNAVGNRTQMIYPDGSAVAYYYDNAGRLSSMDESGRTYSFTYDQLGRRTKLALPNGTSAKYTYDPAGRLTIISNVTSTGLIIDKYKYTMDNVGNRLTKTNQAEHIAYTYNEIYWLVQSQPTGSTALSPESYTYDPVGNRVAGPKPHRTYTYNQANQLITENKQQFQYDNNGSLISHITGSTTISYSYDYENRLTQVIKNANGTITTSEYKYDPFGRRIETDIITASGTDTTKYVYDNQVIIAEYDASGAVVNRYIQGSGMDEHLAVLHNNNINYYHADGLGSVTALTNKKQQVVETIEYDSFGRLTRNGGGINQPYAYTGREWDNHAGLYYYRARYYDQKTGRFISKDPIGFAGGIDLYAYVRNNSVNFVDPLGLFIYGLYNQSTGQLILYDQQTGQSVSAQFFSGGVFGSPVPNGSYDILGHGGRQDFYRLEPVDSPYGDDIQQRTGRDEFRLHKPGGSRGCITAKNKDAWQSVKSFIDSTETSSVQVPSKWVNPIKRWLHPTETLPWYGRIIVEGSN